jgi:hypothetical protein
LRLPTVADLLRFAAGRRGAEEHGRRIEGAGPVVRVDAGDFAAPGVLATLSGGTAGFAAAADLGIDVGVVGNHEPDLAGVAIRHAEEFRAAGAQWVVALFHDGVDWRFGAEGYEVHPERFSEVCRPWARSVDAIFASHTLGRWIGQVEGTPVVQPCPFGAELGVVELAPDDEPKAYCITPETGERWGGTGGELLGEASSRVLGELDEPLLSRSGGPAPLGDFFAQALREAGPPPSTCSRCSRPWTVCSPTCPPDLSARLTSCASTLGQTPPWSARSERKNSGRWLKRRGRGRCGASTPWTDRAEEARP